MSARFPRAAKYLGSLLTVRSWELLSGAILKEALDESLLQDASPFELDSAAYCLFKFMAEYHRDAFDARPDDSKAVSEIARKFTIYVANHSVDVVELDPEEFVPLTRESNEQGYVSDRHRIKLQDYLDALARVY
mmetsp:Transcript_44642/g.61013  ORF Transcript_44642/g.61013 Transcript_44642/m.61013 type:complete len:134 (-) Transcript_44642:102-503(-)